MFIFECLENDESFNLLNNFQRILKGEEKYIASNVISKRNCKVFVGKCPKGMYLTNYFLKNNWLSFAYRWDVLAIKRRKIQIKTCLKKQSVTSEVGLSFNSSNFYIRVLCCSGSFTVNGNLGLLEKILYLLIGIKF